MLTWKDVERRTKLHMDWIKMPVEEREAYFAKGQIGLPVETANRISSTRVDLYRYITDEDRSRISGGQMDVLSQFFYNSFCLSFTVSSDSGGFKENPLTIFAKQERERLFEHLSGLTRQGYDMVGQFPDSHGIPGGEHITGFELLLSNASFGYIRRRDTWTIPSDIHMEPETELTKDLSIADYAVSRGLEMGLYNIRRIVARNVYDVKTAIAAWQDYTEGKDSTQADAPGFYQAIQNSDLPTQVVSILDKVIEQHETALLDETVKTVSNDIFYLMDKMEQGDWMNVNEALAGYTVDQFKHVVELYVPAMKRANITHDHHKFTAAYVDKLHR